MSPMDIHEERNRDGMDFANYVYDTVLHRWVYRPLPPDPKQAEREAMIEEARDEYRRERAESEMEPDCDEDDEDE